MPPFPPNVFGITSGYDPTGRYWQRREGEMFRDFAAYNAMPAMRIANGAPITPRLTIQTAAPSGGTAAGGNAFVGPVRPPQTNAVSRGTYESPLMSAGQYASYGAPLVPAVDLALAGLANAYNQTQGTFKPMQPDAAAAGGGGGGGVTWNIPYGVDPVWYKQFTAEHEGKTPEDVYRRDGEYAIAHALSDKAWGDQFYRTYGRPPSEYDWKASYYQRQNAFYGG